MTDLNERPFCIIAAVFALALCGCTPTPFEMAYGAGVAAAARDEDTVVIDPQVDLGLELAINRAWLDVSRTRFSALDADADNGAVRIWGRVATIDDHIEALRLIWSLPSVASVHSEVNILQSANRNPDLTAIIVTRLNDDPAVQRTRFSVEVIDQSVYLMGRAKTQSELNRVIRHARAAGNVRRVVTLVQVEKAGA
jgi:osmotically-inducible protein OsmY